MMVVMKQRIVVGLTLLFLVGLSAFVSTTVIQNQQKNAFEDLQLTSDSSPNPDASATTTTTPDPCASPTATATAGIGTSPSPAGSSESNINRGGQTTTPDPSATVDATTTPCPSPSPGDGTATATTTATVTATITSSPTADASATQTATTDPAPSPTPTRTATKTITPTPCPTQDDGSYSDPKCDSISVVLRYQVHDKDPRAPKDKPTMRLNPTQYPINGRIDDIKVRFYCDNQPGVEKEVNERGVATLSNDEIGCALTQVKAKVLKYLTDDDSLGQIPRKQTTRMYYLYFRDFDTSDLRDEVGNYIGKDGEIHISNDIGLVVRSGNKERKIIGIQPAVGGIAKVEGNNASERTVCFSYLYLENLGSNFQCSDMQTAIRTKADKDGWYMFGTNKRPWDPPTTPLLNNYDDRLNFGKFIALVHERRTTNVFVTAQNTETLRWVDFDTFKNNPKPLIGRYGEGVGGKATTQWNRKDCGCLDRTEDIVREALKYVVPGSSKTYHCPCAGYVSVVIADSYSTGGKTYQGVGLISGRHGSDLVSALRDNLEYQYAKKGFWEQNWPGIGTPTGWESGYRKDEANKPGSYTNLRYRQKAVAGDVITATVAPGTPGGGGNHAWIYLGDGNSLIANYQDILGGVIVGKIRANGAYRLYAIGTTGQNVGARVIAKRGNVALTDAQNQGHAGHFWAAFSARCWSDWR